MQNTKPSGADVEASKFLSYVLRHKPEAIGLTLDQEGWAKIDALLRLAKKHGKTLSHEQLMRVVAQSDKKRFTLSPDQLRIRAAQGHSTNQVDITFTPKTPPDTLYHGTAERFLASIFGQGLVPGKRQYVHLSPDARTAEIVGKRYGAPAILAVRAAEMAQNSFLFYCSENGVWLTREVPAQYLERI